MTRKTLLFALMDDDTSRVLVSLDGTRAYFASRSGQKRISRVLVRSLTFKGLLLSNGCADQFGTIYALTSRGRAHAVHALGLGGGARD